MKCLKYLSHIAMLAVNQITYWFGVRNECVCNECGSSFDYKDILYDQGRDRCPFCGSDNWEEQD
jgi:anaerobic ribonucleoside-triphosphate reductase